MMDTAVSAETVEVYWALDGGIHHARCSERMVLRALLQYELHVSCLRCNESVTLPLSVLSRIPVAT